MEPNMCAFLGLIKSTNPIMHTVGFVRCDLSSIFNCSKFLNKNNDFFFKGFGTFDSVNMNSDLFLKFMSHDLIAISSCSLHS